MNKAFQKRCIYCNNPFITYKPNQVYCSRACYLLEKYAQYVPSGARAEPDTVRIRLPKRIPVFPEFQLTPGVVYPAMRYKSSQGERITYIVTLDEAHKTIVRENECEEVHDE